MCVLFVLDALGANSRRAIGMYCVGALVTLHCMHTRLQNDRDVDCVDAHDYDDLFIS